MKMPSLISLLGSSDKNVQLIIVFIALAIGLINSTSNRQLDANTVLWGINDRNNRAISKSDTSSSSSSSSSPSSLLSSSSSSSSSFESTSLNNYNDSNDTQLLKEQILMLEFIKVQILNKLGLNEAPRIASEKLKITAYSQVLDLQNYENKQLPSINRINGVPFDANHLAANQSSIKLMSSSPEENGKLFLGPIKRSHFSATFNLTLDTTIHHYPIKKVALFIKFANSYDYWDKDITIIQLKGGLNTTYESFLGKIGPKDDGFNRFHYTENDVQDSDKWKLYDLTNIILREKDNHPSEERLIVIDCEQKKINSTLLSVEFDFSNAGRKKRRIDCHTASDSSSCCRESFYVNFTQIGWNSWIVNPPGYYANYCKGKCALNNGRYQHSTIFTKFPEFKNLCCSPREMSDISLIYLNDQGSVFQRTLPNMVVESCDCA